MIIFGLVFGRLARLATKEDLRELFEKKIMPTQAEIAAGLLEVKAQLTDVATEVAKVGTETDALQAKIVELEDVIRNQPAEASAEVVAALAAVKAQAQIVADGVKVVDDKVPEAPTATPPNPNGEG